MNFSDYDVTRRTRKGNFLKQIDQLIDWSTIEQAIAVLYAPVSDAGGRPAYSGLLLFKMLLAGIWNDGLSDESVEDMANSNLYVMRFLGLSLEDDVPDHSVLSRFRARLAAADAWDGLSEQINRQIQAHNITVRQGCHVDASITLSRRKPKTRPAYEVVSDREDRDDETDAQEVMRIIEVTQLGVDSEARWVRKGGKSGTRIHADKAYYSLKHRDSLKLRGIKNGIQDKAAKNNPLTRRQLQRNSLY